MHAYRFDHIKQINQCIVNAHTRCKTKRGTHTHTQKYSHSGKSTHKKTALTFGEKKA